MSEKTNSFQYKPEGDIYPGGSYQYKPEGDIYPGGLYPGSIIIGCILFVGR